MPKDSPKEFVEKTQIKFDINTPGLYAISVTARCKGKNGLKQTNIFHLRC